MKAIVHTAAAYYSWLLILIAVLPGHIAGCCNAPKRANEHELMDKALKNWEKQPSHAESTKQLAEKLGRVMSETEIRTWASPLLAHARDIRKAERVPSAMWPAFVRQIKEHMVPTGVMLYPPEGTNGAYLNIIWATGRGSEGILISGERFDLGDRFGYVVKFADGISVWNKPL